MSPHLTPPVTDELPLAIRAFAGPAYTDLPDPNDTKRKNSRKPSVAPSSGRVLIYDTETDSDAAQSLRFGTYQYRNCK